MEDEIPHRVTISRGFWVGKYEVTQRQWMNAMGSNPSMFRDGDPGKAPVEGVSWDDCQVFIRKLTEVVRAADRRPELTNLTLRLPTEAEWEYAARGGSASKGFIFSGGNIFDRLAWTDSNSRNRSQPVGKLTPNELGIYDMSGNVWEWTCSNLQAPFDGRQINQLNH
jgi:formylglycine-generating enzyme required for sulfatase activity